MEDRIARIEGRLDTQGNAIDSLRSEMSLVQRESAVLREQVRIFEDLLGEVRAMLSATQVAIDGVRKILSDHVAAESSDRVKLFAGMVTAALSGLGTLGVLIWGVYELLHKVA